ncbi:hypothetical protein N8Z28_00915 [bacterium]|nr:hypothetical protein [bacterium]
MSILLLNPTKWNDYALFGSGDGKKLERFGPYLFSRPEPQACWRKRFSSNIWNNSSGSFLSASSLDDIETSGKWALKSNFF